MTILFTPSRINSETTLNILLLFHLRSLIHMFEIWLYKSGKYDLYMYSSDATYITFKLTKSQHKQEDKFIPVVAQSVDFTGGI